MKFIEKIREIDLEDIVRACLFINVVAFSAVVFVYSATFILYLVCEIATAVAGVL